MKRYKYVIAIYIRLSKEDAGSVAESNSVKMQRLLLQRYAAEHFSDYELLEFCDDGYTGTNFDRPGVQALLVMVKELKIDCILVKDFSRFARDYIELGSYLEQIFPFMGVRFISVNDGYDSKNYHGSLADIDVNFKNLLYDLYSKDLSQKVRSSLSVKKEQGQYVSANCPFGYDKDKKDRHRLLIEEDEADVVRRIFALTLEGNTSSRIARLFNEEGVKTPIVFKIEKGKTSRVPKGRKFLWSSGTICQILRNEVYIGNAVQKKTTREFVGGKNRLNAREDWLVTSGNHEPIIDRETFYRVQQGRGGKRSPAKSGEHPLTGKLVCGCCGKNLCYRTGLNSYFSCSHRYYSGEENCVRRANAMFMEQYVLFMLQEKLSADRELERLRRESADRLKAEIKELQGRRQGLSARAAQLQDWKLEEYQNYRQGLTNAFRSDGEKEESVKKELEDLEARICQAERELGELSGRSGSQDAEGGYAALTKEMLDRYIRKIVVYSEQEIEVYWNTASENMENGTNGTGNFVFQFQKSTV